MLPVAQAVAVVDALLPVPCAERVAVLEPDELGQVVGHRPVAVVGEARRGPGRARAQLAVLPRALAGQGVAGGVPAALLPGLRERGPGTGGVRPDVVEPQVGQRDDEIADAVLELLQVLGVPLRAELPDRLPVLVDQILDGGAAPAAGLIPLPLMVGEDVAAGQLPRPLRERVGVPDEGVLLRPVHLEEHGRRDG